MRTRKYEEVILPFSLYEYAWQTPGSTPLVKTLSNHMYLPVGTVWTTPSLFLALKAYIQDSTGDSGTFRPCFHTVERNAFYAPVINHRFYRGWGGNAYAKEISSSKITGTHALRVPPLYDESYLAEQALAFMMPAVNSGVSLINSLLELKDLKHMNPNPSLKRMMRKHPFLVQIRTKKGKRKFRKELVTRLNNAHLNASFGIVPFVRDLADIGTELMDLAVRLSTLKASAERRLVKHYKREFPTSDGRRATTRWIEATTDNSISWPAGLISDNLANGGSRTNITLKRRARWSVLPVYHATMRYAYALPQIDDTTAYVYLALDRLGVRLDPSIVWNAIPFTFLVDWVVDVGGYLSSLARDNYQIDVQIRDFIHSVKYEREAEIDLTFLCDTGLASTPSYIAAAAPYPSSPLVGVYRGSYRFYDRKQAYPSIASVRLKMPNLKQAALAGSLLLGRTSWGRATRYQYNLAP